MKIVVLEGNPKNTGLCMELTNCLVRGAEDGGAKVSRINTLMIERCRMCGTGEGICNTESVCAFGEDGFDEAQAEVRSADAFIIVSPVYFFEVTECLKSFIERLRRCEKIWGRSKGLAGKPVILAASAGDSGKGVLNALSQMERLCDHTGAKVLDFIAVNRWNREHKFKAAYEAAKEMASGRPMPAPSH